MNEDINEVMADLSLTQDPQRQQPQPPAPRPDVIDQARGISLPSDIIEQARVQPGFDTSRPVSIDGPMNAFAAQRMQALLDPQQQGMLPQQPPVRGMEEPPTVDDTRSLIRDMMASDSAALTASFNQVYKTNSDFAARADRMAKFLGMDMATVERNPQEVQQLFDLMDLQSRDLVRNNPALAQDLTNPGFMAIAKDDLDNLSWWTSGANAWEAGWLTAEKGKLGHELKFLDEQGLKSEGEPIRMRIAEINNRLNQLPVATEGFGSYLAPAAQSVALQAAFLPRSAATGAVVAGTATAIGGAVSGPLAPVVAPLAGIAGFFKAGGISQTLQSMETYSGLSYLEQLEQGVSPEVAYYSSSVSGTVVGALDKLGFSAAAAPLKKALGEMTAKELAKALAAPTWGEIAKRYGMEAVKTGAAELTTETAQEFVDILVEDLGRSFTKGELDSKFATEKGRAEIQERILETMVMTLKGQAILAPTFGSPTLFGGIYQRRAMAEQQKKLFEDISKNAAESKVRKRDPNVYEAIVGNQLNQLEQLGGADAKTIYVAPERFLEAMQGVGMTEAELLKLLPDQIESIREAIRNGSDIQIPTAKFASTLADTDLGRALILDMRLSDNPNVLSAREAEEQGKQLREQIEAAAKAVDEDIAADKALEADIRAVEDLFYEQNVRIPNIGKDNAKALAVMQTRMVHTLARESGMPLQDFYAKYRAQFTEAGKPPMFEPQVGTEPAELFDSLGQRKTDTPQFKAWFGDSKVVDEQGQPKVMYHGTWNANFTEFNRGQMRSRRPKFGIDTMGSWFTSDPSSAEMYGPQIMPVYLNISNPYSMTVAELFGPDGSSISDLAKNAAAIARERGKDVIAGDVIREQLMAQGYDGIKIVGNLPLDNLPGDVYIAFNPTQIKSVNNRGTFDPASANILEQVEKLDADYMAAVGRGDMETAQRMVDEAAKAAGYNRKAYHGSASKPFWVFDPAKRGQRTGSNSALLGFFASSKRQVASEYQLTESERRRFNQPTQFAFGLEAAEAEYGRKTEIVTAGVFDKDQNGWVAQLTEYDQFGSEFTYEDEYVYDSQVEAENAAEEYKEKQVKEAQAVLDKKLAEFAEEEKELRAERTLHDLWVRLENPLIYDFKGGSFRDKSYTELVKEAVEDGHDGVVMRNTMDAIDSGTLSDVIVFFNSNQAKLADPVTRDDQGNIIPLSRRFNLQSPSILEQLGEEAQPQAPTGFTAEFNSWFSGSKVVDAQGKPLVVYHGARRPDRIGKRFRKSRATSGPMAFFTDNPDVASNYATGKADTSLETPLSYAEWFKFKPKGQRSKVSIDRAWHYLSVEQRENVAKLAPRVTTTDDGGQIILGPDNHKSGLGGYDWHIKEHRGNHLAALVEEWLTSGSLYGDEVAFLDVLRLVGIDADFDSPEAAMPSVFPVYLKIKNPLDTSNIPEDVIEALRKAGKNKRAPAPALAADPWDKRGMSGKYWIERLDEDVKNNTTYAWTTVPDWATKTLQGLGYDGIQDTGGKMGGMSHAVWIPFEENQVKAQTNSRPTETPGLLSQLANGPNPGFYSALLRSMDAVTAKALPANGWKDQIRGLVNKGTVKQAEVEWSGLNEWLDMQEGKVTKESVVAFLQGNGVNVETVILGARVDVPEYVNTRNAIRQKADELDALKTNIQYFRTAITNFSGSPSEMQRIADAFPYLQPLVGNPDAMLDRLFNDRKENLEKLAALEDELRYLRAKRDSLDKSLNISPAKFGHYVLPNGKDYREVLLILPVASGRMSVQEIDARLNSLANAMANTESQESFDEMAQASNELRKERRKAIANERKFIDTQHWQRDNVLAHLRMNDRVDADGKRVLFIEEVQSDWGQKGREEGFDKDFAELQTKYDKAQAERDAYTTVIEEKEKVIEEKADATFEYMSLDAWLARDGFSESEINDPFVRKAQNENYESDKLIARDKARHNLVMLDAELKELRHKRYKVDQELALLYKEMTEPRISRAPFVETTKGWVELALKKVMLIAAEGGYDRVAFTSGAENAERYNLAKQVSKISYNQKTHVLSAYDLGGTVFHEQISPEKVKDYVGDDLAKKLTSESELPKVMSREEFDLKFGLQTSRFAGRDTPWVVVRGDQIILAEKTRELAEADIVRESVILEGLDLEVGGEGMKAFYDKIMPNYLKDLLAKFGKTKTKMVNVEGIGEHLGFDVTPELLDKISEGLPLFAPTQRGTFDPRTLVSAILSGGKSDTVMHEMWHYYFVMLERFALAGEAPPKLAQDFDTLLAWLKVPGATAAERLAAWRNMTFEQRKPYHENTAYAWEIWLSKGEAPSVELEGIFKRMLRWFRETYNDIVTELKALYRQNYGRELILPTSEIEQIFARAVASQEEIDRAMAIRNIKFPYTDAQQAEMRPEALAALKDMWEEMVEEAVINVTGKAISDMQWLSGADTPAMRDMQKRHDTLREQVREQVAEQVRMEPVYRAMRHFQTGEMVAADGTVSNAGSNYKLNSRMTQALLPEGKTLTSLRGMTNRKGLDPSEVAQWYGYPDGKTFVAALADAKPMTEEIKERTDKRMLEEHGDLVNPVQRQRAIERAINNDTRTQFLAAVLRHTDLTLRKSVDAMSPAAQKQLDDATAKLAELKQTREALRAQLRQAEEAKLAEVIDATNEQLRDNQRAIARERRKISGPITPVRDIIKAAERNADQTLATKKVGEVSSYRYGQQQARASRDAQEAVKKLDLAEVARAQQKELILHALTKKAAEFEDFVADKLDDYRKFSKDTEKLRKTRDMDLVNVAKAILASYGMGVEVDGIDKRLERFKEANPELYAEFEGLITDAKANARPYRELTVEEFQAVTDAVDRLWYEAKRRLEVGKGEERQALSEVVDLMIDRVAKIGMDATPPGTTGKETEAEQLAVQIVDAASCVTRIQHWCNKMDELTVGLEAGVFTKYIWRRIQDATSEYLLARDKEIKELADLSKALYTGGPTIYSKHLGYTFGRDRGHSGKAEIMGMWLQAGNRDNLERMLTNREITMDGHPDKGKLWGAIDEVTGELDTSRFMAATQEFIADGTLTEADFDWFQSMWDKMDQITEKYLQPAHKQQTGDYLDLIPPDSFTIRFKDGKVKTYKGGYMPSKIDPAVSRKGREIATFTELEQDIRQRRPKAADGMTKKRVQGAQGARVMDPLLVVQAVDEELRYSILGPAINDILKFVNDDRLNAAMDRFDRNFLQKTLLPWLNLVAAQRVTQPSRYTLFGKIASALRVSVAMQALGFNPINAAQNLTGIPTGMYKAGPIGYTKAVGQFLANPKKVVDVIVKSDGIMAERLRLSMFDAETEMKRIFENPTAFNTTIAYVRSSMMILQKVTQNFVDITVWLASYNKAMRSMGADKNNAEAHAEAVRRARETVTLTQYSQRPEDVAQVEVGSAEYRLMSQFWGYINGLAQLTGGEWKKYVRSDLGLPAKAAHLIYIYLLVWLAPSLVNDLIKRAFTSDWEDEDDNGYIDGMFYEVAIKPALQSIPFGGQAADLAISGFDTNPYNDKLNIAPAVSMVTGAVTEASEAGYKWYRSGELGAEQIYDWITLMGYLTKFPTRPFIKPLEYEAKVEAGKIQPTSSYDYYRGLVTGRASPESKQ